ncbi:MAG: 4-hydroxybenzoate octaprenyltransferase [Gemmatimonadota bacterium]|nr:MAG: 4-hydroxybenzoate octaprenyltransferase [Gemmatimonadota bacterium]
MRRLLDFVKFEHTVFSIPLLLAGAFLGADGPPSAAPLLWIVVAGTGARTLAMALNRIFDRKIDARNPRTATRELPSGRMSLASAVGVAAGGLALLVWAVWNLPPLCARLLPIPLAIFVIYPLMKRFTALAHFGVGAGLAFGPIGAYVAVTGELPRWGGVHLLALFTWAWVAGFDIIYATLDEDFDREAGLHSLPAALGRSRSLAVAALVHVAALVALAALTFFYLSGVVAWGLLAATGALLALEHRMVHRVDFAFFKINAVLGFVVFALVWAGL